MTDREKKFVSESHITYEAAGVSIDSGNDLVSAIRPAVNSTKRKGVASELGGFGAMFDLKAAGYVDPILVAATDGVGTKLLIASALNQHNSIGIDLVAMCVNDLVVMGAEPLLFLDYFATGKLDLAVGEAIIEGIAEGCKLAGCALVGGETAEMPGMYAPPKYDLAGFCVGAVERDRIHTENLVREGDIILGLASSGIHSNGFSLIRRLINNEGMRYNMPAPFAKSSTIGQLLLTPTKIYVRSCLTALKMGGVHALAHITGGGFIENLPRVLPKGLGVQIHGGSWIVPDIFQWIATLGNIKGEEMLRTFNCGIGMVAVVSPKKVNEIKQTLINSGEKVFEIGEITHCKNDDVVDIKNQELLWKN